MRGGVWSKARRDVIYNRYRNCENIADRHEKTRCRVDNKRNLAQAYWNDPYDLYDDNEQIRTIKELLENKHDQDIEDLVDHLEKIESFSKSRAHLIKSRKEKKIKKQDANSPEKGSTDGSKSAVVGHNPDFLRDWRSKNAAARASRLEQERQQAANKSQTKLVVQQRNKEYPTLKRKHESPPEPSMRKRATSPLF